MAARTKNTEAQNRQQHVMRALYPQELKDGRDIFGNFFPHAAQNIVDLAGGASYQKMKPDGSIVTMKSPPDLAANIYIVNRFLGVPRAESDEVLDRLNLARAVFIEEQVVKGLIESQVREVLSRAQLKEVEASYWPKQFVTEEQQQEQIQALAEALLTKLMALTPEEYAAINDGRDPQEALETLKGKIGRELSEVVGEVMGGQDRADPDLQEEDEEEDDGRISEEE